MNEHYPFQLAPLPYACNVLEPYLDSLTVTIHHDHHQGNYVKKLNEALCNYPNLHSWSLEQLICDAGQLPKLLKESVPFNAAGVWCHELYFDCMTRPGCEKNCPVGTLAEMITRTYGCFEHFQDIFVQTGLARSGSGWTWLAAKPDGELCVLSTPLNETPLTKGMRPVLVTDVWEHAYYLKYHYRRDLYLQNWWRLVDWTFAEECYLQK